MKKYISILAIFAVAAIACNKVEPQVVEEAPEVVSGTNTVSFSANLPAFGVESKATISNTGEFAWDEDDWIYVLAYSKSKNSLWHVPFKYNTTTQQFTCDFPVSMYYIGGAENVQLDRVATREEAAAAHEAFALYPDPQGATTEVAYDRVQKLFKMEGNLNSSGEIVFEHKSAIVNVHIANVPSFASYFTVAGGAETVKVVNLNGIAAIDKAVPITPTGSASDIVITLYDSANNVIISKKKSGKTLVAGTLYDTPLITVGRVITFDNQAGWAAPYVSVWNGDYSYQFKSIENDLNAEYPWKLNQSTSGKYYIILNNDTKLYKGSETITIANVDNVGIWFGNSDNGTETARVYLDRDLNFTIPDGGGLKTNYRIYAKCNAATPASMKIYVYENWESYTPISATWPGDEMTASTILENYFYWELPVSYYAYDNLALIFYNPTTGNQAGGEGCFPDTSTRFDKDIKITFNDFWKENTSFAVE